MKIAHVTATFPPYHGGTGAVCYHNALGLAERGHQIDVFTAAHPPGEFTYPAGISVHRLPVKFRVGNAPFLPGLAGMRGYDVVHLHYPFVFGQETIYALSWLRGMRYVITYHQDLILDGLTGLGVKAHHATLGKLILRRTSRLLVTSLDYASHARIAPLVRAIESKVSDMPNGVDTDRFNPTLDGSPVRRKYGLTPDDRVVLFVGGLDTPHYFKGVEVLLRALSRIDDFMVKLLIVGEGDLRPRYTALAAELGLSQRVIFCGRVEDEALPLHYAACDLFVLPSVTMGEAFGIVLLEAMACEKPVIASRLPGVRSVVGEGQDGLLVMPNNDEELADKIRQLLADPARLRAMGACGRSKVEALYAWPKVIDRLERVYQEVLADA